MDGPCDHLTPPKFNSLPLKSYLPNRKGLSSNHFSGSMLNFGGVYLLLLSPPPLSCFMFLLSVRNIGQHFLFLWTSMKPLSISCFISIGIAIINTVKFSLFSICWDCLNTATVDNEDEKRVPFIKMNGFTHCYKVLATPQIKICIHSSKLT